MAELLLVVPTYMKWWTIIFSRSNTEATAVARRQAETRHHAMCKQLCQNDRTNITLHSRLHLTDYFVL